MLRMSLFSLSLACVFVTSAVFGQSATSSNNASPARKIVLIAGETAKQDTVGHHDYLAGCKCLAALLSQTAGVRTEFVENGWPQDERVFEGASSVVFYTDGGGKQAFLKTPERIARMEALAKAGVGFVCIHQAVDFPAEFAQQGKKWLGGVYFSGSGRGHWPSAHVEFPEHPITRGVEPWKINDGWLNELQFVEGMSGVTPLVWSGKVYQGSRSGREADIVGWAYERPDGGRSFSFTGLDAHSALSLPGMRQLVLNGVLWSAGADIPAAGAPDAITEEQLASFLTPREPKPAKKKK